MWRLCSHYLHVKGFLLEIGYYRKQRVNCTNIRNIVLIVSSSLYKPPVATSSLQFSAGIQSLEGVRSQL